MINDNVVSKQKNIIKIMSRFPCFWLIFPSLLMFCLENHPGLVGPSVPCGGLLQFMAVRSPSISMLMWPNLMLVFLHWILQVYQQLYSLVSTWHSTLWRIFSPWREQVQYKRRDLQDPQEKMLYILKLLMRLEPHGLLSLRRSL